MSPSAASGDVFFHAALRNGWAELHPAVAVKCTWTHSPFAASFVPLNDGFDDELTSRTKLSETWAAKLGAPESVTETTEMLERHVGTAIAAYDRSSPPLTRVTRA